MVQVRSFQAVADSAALAVIGPACSAAPARAGPAAAAVKGPRDRRVVTDGPTTLQPRAPAAAAGHFFQGRKSEDGITRPGPRPARSEPVARKL
eukprot:243512-Hanusia_phi.AAC.1